VSQRVRARSRHSPGLPACDGIAGESTSWEPSCLDSAVNVVTRTDRVVVDWELLQEGIAGEVIPSDAPEYESVRKPALARFESVRPRAVVLCRAPADVSATIAFAKRIGLQIAIRSGGHSVAGRSSTEGIVVDVTPMSTVGVKDGVATVGAGVRLGHLYDALQEHGLTIPAGCGPDVGIAGLTLGGGIGILGRTYGLTCDHLLRAQIVLADGRLVVCDEHRHGDLFWALRGAGGGNFGVVTSLVFRTVPAPSATVFHAAWPPDHAIALVEAWQRCAPSAPDGIDATLRLGTLGDCERGPQLDVVGAVVGSEADAAEFIGELTARAGTEPARAWRQQLPYREAKRRLDEIGSLGDQREPPGAARPAPQGHLFTKSEFFRQPLPRDTIRELVDNLSRGVAIGHTREINFLPWGGAYNRVPADATAFPHREELFLVQHMLDVTAQPSTSQHDAGASWLARSWALVHPWGSGGVYPNFPDPDLQDWALAYYRENHNRLSLVKALYDPDNFFRFHQSLPSPGPTGVRRERSL
jgi:FAD/FMN-containing dehydrogenase